MRGKFIDKIKFSYPNFYDFFLRAIAPFTGTGDKGKEVGKKPHFQLFLSFRFSRFDVLPFHSRSDQGCSSGSEIESRGQTGGERGGGGEEEGGGGGT